MRLREARFGGVLQLPELARTSISLPRMATTERKLPRHIAVIMDGNGRWAQRQGLPRIEGHRRGVASVRRITEECTRLGIEQLTLYCLSSENWKRPPEELDFLMHLLEQYMIEERSTIMEQDISVRVIGRRDGIPPATLAEMDKTIAMTAGNHGTRLCLAINYGGRAELLDTVPVDRDRCATRRARSGDAFGIDDSRPICTRPECPTPIC